MESLLFSTGNESKYQTALGVCAKYGVSIKQSKLDVDEIQGEDPTKIVTHKAQSAYYILKQPVLVSDDSWEIPGLQGFPGPYMKSINHWFTVDDFVHLTKPLADRRVFLLSYLAYTDGNTTMVFAHKREGTLLEEPRGKNGPAAHKIIAMSEDGGLSVAEYFDKKLPLDRRDSEKHWHDFIKWYVAR